ncbi:MAG: amino acid adenylation domain-containing protein [Rikenellaceae bacterium]
MKRYHLIQEFQSAVSQFSSNIALSDCSTKLTFSEADTLARQIATKINSLGVASRSNIVIVMEGCAEYLPAMFGVWYSNNIVVPLESSQPGARIQNIIEQCDAPLIINKEFIAEARECAPFTGECELELEDDAALFFTSGSTGTPKGIIHTLGSFGGGIQRHKEVFSTDTSDVFAYTAPFYFIAQTLLYPTLLSGGRVNIVPYGIRRNIKELEAYIVEQQITQIFIGASLLKFYNNREGSALRRVFTGSERVSMIPPSVEYQTAVLYGMSETTPQTTYFPLDKEYHNTPIGKPFSGVEVLVLDDNLNEVAVGTEGEICLKGNFTRGYYKNPEQTEELFRGGVLHTNDIGMVLEDGNLVYVNRKNWMLKVNGQRVEPGEIEAIAKDIEGVRDVIVKGFERDDAQTYMCLYYIASEGFNADTIREHLAERLPSYMVPSYYIAMESFPVNANGKIDRLSLSAPSSIDLQSQYVAPTNEVERRLCQAFSQVLHIEKIGIDDDFVRMGGDSILSVKLQTLLPQEPLSTKIIYSCRTPRTIAAELEREALAYSFTKQESYPLSQTQMGIYIESMSRRGEICYNNPRLLTLSNDIDMTRLATAIEKTVEAHPYIKTRIKSLNSGEATQIDNSDKSYSLSVREIHTIEDIKSGLVRPFDLESDELFRFEVLSSSDHKKYLFLDLHHIIFDGTSFDILMCDIQRAYNAEELTQEPYSGFEIAQREEHQRSGAQYTEAKEWHSAYLGGVDVVSLPITDHPKSPITEFQRVVRPTRLTTNGAKKVCSANKVTENVLFNAAFSYLLSAYNNDKEAFFATIYNGRSTIQSASTVAMMVKTLPLYTSFESITTLPELLQITKDRLLGAMANDLYSFAEVCGEFGLSSELLFAYQGDLMPHNTFCGSQINIENLLENATGSTLSVQVFKDGEHYSIDCQYSATKYSAALIESFIDTFENILNQLPHAEQLSGIALSSEKGLSLLDSFNSTEVEYDRGQTLVSLFRESVAKYPDHTAVVFKDRSYTYRELDTLSDRLAGYITGLGIGRDSVVAVLINRSEYIAIATLGILKSGALYQPLDPSYPSERLNFMVSDSGAKLLIADQGLVGIIENPQLQTLLVSDIATLEESAYSVDITPEDKYVILYTSGSTGQPKGCLLTHSNMVAYMSWCCKEFEITPQSRCSNYASYGFDATMYDTYMALCHGASLYIIPEEMRLDLAALETYFNECGITHSLITTQVGRQFVLSTEPTTLKHLSVGGEALSSITPPTAYQLHNLYGPTECTVSVTNYRLKEEQASIPIGRAIDNIKIYIVDKDNRRMPVGAPGELLISGRQVGAGYLNREELSEKVFTDNPFSSDENYSKLYHTGDVVRYLPDGNIEFIGRRDSQVKIRGFRIELSEVETIIREFSGIRDVTVQSYDKDSGGKYIAAYIVADSEVDISALSEFILENKPPYILPEVIMQIEKIPLTVNHKVDKRALPKPEVHIQESDAAPRELNLLEKEILGIVQQSLSLKEEVALTTPLSYVGLSSITAIKLSMLLYKRFGVSFDSKELVKRATIIELENTILEAMLSGATSTVAEPKVVRTSRSSMPLSASQMGVYIDSMKNPTLTTYNIPIMLRIQNDRISSEMISSAAQELVNSSENFSLRFDVSDGEVQQILCPESNFTVEKLSITSNEEIESVAHDFVRPFNLAKGGLCRAMVVEAVGCNYLLLDFHHLVFDGSSCDLFINNLTEILSGNELEKSSYTYLDFVEEQNSADDSKAEAFYKGELTKIEGSSEIPSDLSGNAQDGKLEVASITLKNPNIEIFCKEREITPAQLFLAVLHYTTSRFTNSAATCLNTVSSGRSNLKIAQNYGMFVNTLPLVAQRGEESVEEYIKMCGENFEGSIENEHYPFAKLATDYNLSTNIMYSYLVGVINQYSVNGDRVELIPLEHLITGTKSKLSVHIERPESEFVITAQYNDAIYSKTLMLTFVEAMAVTLDNFIASPAQQVGKISMVSDAQRALLEKFESTAQGDIPITLYHKGIEDYAQRTPNATALIASGAEFTYAEFNAEANRIANALLQRGIEQGSRIALLLPREWKLIAAMFGVLKAGGAYIPCDPEYPTSRTQYIIEDSQAQYIITTRDRATEFESSRALVIDTLLECSDTQNPNLEISSDSLAYLIYTSGSTGKPKGVMLQHKGITNYLSSVASNIHVYAFVEQATKYLSVTTVAFDMCLKEIGVTLFNGKTLIFANEEEANNPVQLAELFEKTGADCFNATASRMLGYLEYEPLCEAFSRCKIIMSGGEGYPMMLLDRLREVTDAQIFNTYGPTEITVSSNAKNLTHSNEISVGRPLYNYREYIVDSNENLLPVGVVGELYIGGIGVAVGYNNLEEMTKEKFIEFNGQRIYKSGDYAKWTTQGDVMILGRTDNQIKLRGLRIEIGEIEGAMAKIEGIRRVAIKIVSIGGKEHICAYYTAETTLDVDAIKTQLKDGLTHYMVPTLYVQLDNMPLTPNGKTDLKSLPTPTIEVEEREIEAAHGKIEEKLCAIFARTLSLDVVGATDNFFDLGGTSLSVTRIIIEAQKEGLSVAYGDLFQFPTPRSLSDFIKKTSGSDSTDSEIEDYDYTKINELLSNNTIQAFSSGEAQPVGDVLLTGATGFLGIHILREVIEKYPDSKIYCLIRNKSNIDTQKRLKSILYYYFEHTYEALFDTRIFIASGDVTSKEAIAQLEDKGISTVINCAANVKHFSKGSDIEDTNIGGVLNLIDFCKNTSAKLIHISTMSVGGMSVDNYPMEGTSLHENELYLGQQLDNKYTHSKFLAERHILENVVNGELSAKIMRVGNLSARDSDGEFQINFSTNSFMGRLRSFNLMGCAPYDVLDSKVEFSPIDQVSNAIMLLSQTPKSCVLFHPYNHHLVLLVDVFSEMTKLSLDVTSVDMAEYQEVLSRAKSDEKVAKILSSIIAYEDMGHGKRVVPVAKFNGYTMQVLYRLGFLWATTSRSYINRMLSALMSLGYFDKTL